MTESDDLRAEDDVVFALLGRTATNLSYLEFAVSELLQVLLDPNEPIVSALVTEEMPLARRIQNIRKLAALRFILDGAAKNRLINLANRLDGYKCKRNLFVHGHWKLTATPTGVAITCVDYRWDISPKANRSWSRLREHNWTKEELETFNREVRDITQETLDEIAKVRRELEKANKSVDTYKSTRADAGCFEGHACRWLDNHVDNSKRD